MVDIPSICSGLTLGADGIWYGSDRGDISYPDFGNDACAAVEDGSWWFKHRNDCIAAAVRKFPPEQGNAVFDIGGGNGFVGLGLMQAGFDVALIEPGVSGAAMAKRRGIPSVVCATVEAAGIRDNSLAAAGLFDVIEHMEEEAVFLGTVRRLLKPGGYLYATAPAYPFLWGREDEWSGHFRRYTRSSMFRSMTSASFEVAYFSYIFRPLPFPILLFRSIPYRLGSSRVASARRRSRDHGAQRGLVNKMMSWALKGEVANIANAQPMRFGGSCIVVARAV